MTASRWRKSEDVRLENILLPFGQGTVTKHDRDRICEESGVTVGTRGRRENRRILTMTGKFSMLPKAYSHTLVALKKNGLNIETSWDTYVRLANLLKKNQHFYPTTY